MLPLNHKNLLTREQKGREFGILQVGYDIGTKVLNFRYIYYLSIKDSQPHRFVSSN